MKFSNFIICDDGSTAIESLLYKSKKTKVFRIISSIEPPLFSKIKEIPVLESASQIEHFLNTKKNNSKINKKKIIADYMFREDFKASNRMLKLNF